jgi:hypothetical protein
MNGKSFKLRDESTGFHDPETGLKVVRGQKVKVGSAPGKMTMQAIQVGRLVEVETEPGIAGDGEARTRGTRGGEISKRGGGAETQKGGGTRDRAKRDGIEERVKRGGVKAEIPKSGDGGLVWPD